MTEPGSTALRLDDHVPERVRSEEVLGRSGFRPFFALAAGFAGLAMPTWLAHLWGFGQPGGVLGAMHWHAHEMVFGFAMAVVAGFLLTAVSNWTGRTTAVGVPLLALAAVWIAGRAVGLAAGVLSPALVAAVQLAFVPLLIVAIARPMLAVGNRRNYGFVGMLLALWLADLATHAVVLQWWPVDPRRALTIALDVLAIMMALVTTRIVPLFTRNTTSEAWIANRPWLDRLALLAVVSVAIGDSLGPQWVAPLSLTAGILLIVRTHRWGWRPALRNPLLWVLHLGHAWLALAFVLRGFAVVPEIAATHALTVGALGTLTLGMMVRVALGHTGRPLRASRAMTLAFVGITLAAAIRVATPIVAVPLYRGSLAVSGLLFSLAFAVYLFEFWPILSSPRADGRPG